MKPQKKTQAIPSLSAAASEEEIIQWVQAHDVEERLDAGVSEVVEDHRDLERIVEDAQYEGNTACSLSLVLQRQAFSSKRRGYKRGTPKHKQNDFFWG